MFCISFACAPTNGVVGVSNANSTIILHYLQDMERGINVATSNKKGSRSYIRLHAITSRLGYLAREFEKRYNVNLMQLDEQHVLTFFSDMRNGTIKRRNGQPFKAVADYVKDFKAFWHWHMKASRKQGTDVKDIALDLDTSKDKPEWVYLTEEEVRKLSSEANYKYEVLIWFKRETKEEIF